MIIVNHEIQGKDLFTRKFNKFSEINIKYDEINILIYNDLVPDIEDLIKLNNLKKLYIYSNEIMIGYNSVCSINDSLKNFLNSCGSLEQLQLLSVIGYILFDKITKKISCFDNLPYSLEILEFSLDDSRYPASHINIFSALALNNLPICLKEIRIDTNESFKDVKINESDIKIPFNCEVKITHGHIYYHRYRAELSINGIYGKPRLYQKS